MQFRHLSIWMPLVSNATFLFSPCIGMLIDSYGFIPAVQILWSTVVSSVLSLWLLPMSYQWWTLLSLNWLQTVTYSLQFTYIAQRYPSDQFGVVMAFSTVAQSAVNLLGLYLLTRPPKLAALVFILPTCIICQVSGPQVGGCQVAGWFFDFNHSPNKQIPGFVFLTLRSRTVKERKVCQDFLFGSVLLLSVWQAGKKKHVWFW